MKESGEVFAIICDAAANIDKPACVWIFGSRADGNYRKYSDVDLLLSLEFSGKMRSEISDKLSESNLPYFFDVVSEQSLEESYREHIIANRIKWITAE